MKPSITTKFDVLVVGGGHAGVEAALAADRKGLSVGLITLDPEAVGRMSCNPAIGGIAKGQMVREVDALGGIMGFMADQSGLQFKILNRSKGRAVWSPRAQVDKRKYETLLKNVLRQQSGVVLITGEVVSLLLHGDKLSGVMLRDKTKLHSNSVVLTCGTFLNGLIHVGERKIKAGRMGERPAEGITEYLTALGFQSGRLKTGTPPRLVANTINWTKLKEAWGDSSPQPFSYRTVAFDPPNVPCHVANTNNMCHEIIQRDINLSPMFSGDISGVGPRYCPSIEDKIHRFSDKPSHQLFLEPEWAGSNQVYTNGFSTSLPEKTQRTALQAIPGLEQVDFFRPGYAIEYDFFPAFQLSRSLATKSIPGLFFAGQINGTSGYEEAAAQGLIAGTNAANHVMNNAPLTLQRDEAYIGVLIDDLVTKETFEPYRMFTARAEYRILMRFTSAGKRLSDKALKQGLISPAQFDRVSRYIAFFEDTTSALHTVVTPEEINPTLVRHQEKPIIHNQQAAALLRRPPIGIDDLPRRIFSNIDIADIPNPFIKEMRLEAEITIKYSGYIDRQKKEIERLLKNEQKTIPVDFDYTRMNNISIEAREKLAFIQPETLGQAMRISGVSPADAAVLAVCLFN